MGPANPIIMVTAVCLGTTPLAVPLHPSPRQAA